MGKKKGLLGGVVGEAKEALFGGNTDEEDAKAAAAAQAALDEWEGLEAPILSNIDFSNYEWMGDYQAPASVVAPHVKAGKEVDFETVDPRLADAYTVDGSSFDDIESDPRLKEAQMGSLGALDDIIAGGGMTAKEQADMARLQSDVAAADKGRRDAIIQNMHQRGMGGSGMELLAQLQSNQAATNQAAQGALDINAMAQQRALESIMSKGDIAGKIRGQDWGEASQAAEARDAIAKFNAGMSSDTSKFNASTANDTAQFNASNKFAADTANRDHGFKVDAFNAGNSIDVQKTNAGYANDAAFANWQGKQNISNANVDTNNKEKMHNQFNVPQATFDNKTKLASGKAGAHGANQAYWTGMGDREAAEADGMFGAATQLGTAAIMASDKKAKKEVKEVSPEEIEKFLNSLSPKKFKYKEPSKEGRAEGVRVGVMAQEIEKTPIGAMIVTETSDGTKALDKDNLLGTILASLAHLSRKK